MKISIVACIGTGIVGQGWATLFSSQGLQVNLQDASMTAIEMAIKRVRANLTLLEQKKLLKKGATERALNQIKVTENVADAVEKADYIQESVPDNYEVKKKVFREIDALARRQAIIASSSSGLLMTEIQKVVKKPDRCVMAHPLLPLYIIPLIEISGGKKTSKQTIITTHDFMVKLGKVPVVINKEVPGFIVNRLNAALWREAVSLVASGVATAEDVDRAFCMGIGLRDPLLGPCLRAHVAGGGIENFISNYAVSYSNRWKTMESWTSIPQSKAMKITKSINEMDVVRTKTLEEIERLRDEKLIGIFKVILPDHPFYRKVH